MRTPHVRFPFKTRDRSGRRQPEMIPRGDSLLTVPDFCRHSPALMVAPLARDLQVAWRESSVNPSRLTNRRDASLSG